MLMLSVSGVSSLDGLVCANKSCNAQNMLLHQPCIACCIVGLMCFLPNNIQSCLRQMRVVMQGMCGIHPVDLCHPTSTMAAGTSQSVDLCRLHLKKMAKRESTEALEDDRHHFDE